MDKNLTFKWYVQLLTGKALKVANALKFLVNKSRGAPPRLLRQVTIASVLSIAYFGSEVWWPGRNRTTPKGLIVSNRVETHLSLIRKVVLTSARAILPVYRTTPSAALFREAGLFPPLIELDKRARAAALRIHKLDPRHPLRRRSQWFDTYNRRVSRLSGWILSLPTTEYIDPLVLPPWASIEGWYASIRRVTQNSTQLPTSIPFNDLVAYTDGSRLGPNTSAGLGVVIHQAGRIVYVESKSINRSFTSFDTEVKAAAVAMSAALQLPSARFANDFWILLDNQDVARRLFSSPVCSSQTEFLQFADKAKSWGNRPRLPHTRPGQVQVAWIPGHSGIPGNDHADNLARSSLPSSSSPSTYSYDAAKLWAITKTESALK